MKSFLLRNRECRPIGLDIGHSSIKMIQLAANNGSISVVAAEKVNFEPGINGDEKKRKDFIVSSIRKLMAGGRFKGSDVISSIQNEQLRITSIRLSQSQTDGIDEILKKEVANRFNLDAEKDSINYILAGNVRQGEEIMNEYILFAADSRTIKEHIETLEEAKLRPVGIEPVPYALFRSFERLLRREEDKEQAEVFIDIGSCSSTVVFSRAGELGLVKHIPIGTEQINQEIAGRLGLSDLEAESLRYRMLKFCRQAANEDCAVQASEQKTAAVCMDDMNTTSRQVASDAIGAVAERLAKEILLCFRYYTVTFRGKRVQRAVFTGGGAYEDSLLGILKQQLSVDIEVAQPLLNFDMKQSRFESDRRGANCEWAVAVGLGLKGCDLRGRDGKKKNRI
jgi:type IV pilus assembly protein PilM